MTGERHRGGGRHRTSGCGRLGLVGLLALSACTSTAGTREPVEGDTRGVVIGAAGAPPPAGGPGQDGSAPTSWLHGSQRWRLRHPAREGQNAGFTTLGLDRLYASVIPANTASRRVFEKLGYVADPTATEYGDDGDLVLRIERADFLARHAAALAEIELGAR